MQNQPIFSHEQAKQIAQIKSYRPFAIVWGALDDRVDPPLFEVHASYNKRKLNKYLRQGWKVAIES